MRGWTLLLSSASSCLRSHAFTTSSMMRWPRNLSTTITNPIPSSSSSMRLRLLRQQLKLQHHHHQHHPSSNNANPLQHVFRFLSTTRVHSLSQQPSPNPPNNNNNNNTSNHRNLSNDTTLYYIGSIIVFFVGLSYAAVPLYQILCTQTGIDGTPVTALTNNTTSDPAKMVPVKGARPIRISFDASTSDTMRWQFTPVTRSMHVLPGEYFYK